MKIQPTNAQTPFQAKLRIGDTEKFFKNEQVELLKEYATKEIGNSSDSIYMSIAVLNGIATLFLQSNINDSLAEISYKNFDKPYEMAKEALLTLKEKYNPIDKSDVNYTLAMNVILRDKNLQNEYLNNLKDVPEPSKLAIDSMLKYNPDYRKLYNQEVEKYL